MKRYVMGNRDDGTADVLFEDDLDPHLIPLRPREIWLNTATPADLSHSGDPVAEQIVAHEPPDGGAIFRVLVFPSKQDTPNLSAEDMVKYHQSIHSAHIPSLEYLRSAKNVSMHKTDTLNYFVLIEGEIWALTEGKDVLLRAGDVIVQLGCMHGWRNDSDKRAVLVAVLIDAHPA